MEDKSLIKQLQHQAQFCSFAARFGFALSRKVAETLAARLWYPDSSRKRNAWPLKTDLVIALMRAGITNAPPSIALLQKYQPGDVPVNARKASVLPCVLEVANPPSLELIENLLLQPDLVDCSPASLLKVQGEWIFPAEKLTARVPLAQSLDALLVSSCPIVIYCHGGAYCFGSAPRHRFVTVPLAVKSRALLLSLDYRLAPENPFPAGLQDLLGAYQWLLTKGVQPSRIVFAGDSAGGGLTMAALLFLNQLRLLQAAQTSSFTRVLGLPAAAVCLSGWFDIHCTADSWGKTWRTMDYLPHNDSALLHECGTAYAGKKKDHPLVSPLLAPEHVLRGLPPVLLQVGGSERILHDVEAMGKLLEEAQVSVTLEAFPNEVHVFQAIPGSVHAKKAFENIGTFINHRVNLVSRL